MSRDKILTAFDVATALVIHGYRYATHLFDLDDTLLKTRELVIEAYERVGLPRQRVIDNWGRPYQAWVGEDLHNKKAQAYRDLLKEKQPDTTCLYRMIPDERLMGPRFITTGASEEAYELLKSYFSNLPPAVGLRRELCRKVGDILLSLRDNTSGVVYYDDSLENIRNLFELVKLSGAEHVNRVLMVHYHSDECLRFFPVTDSIFGETSWTV